jgi:hypothetical protein
MLSDRERQTKQPKTNIATSPNLSARNTLPVYDRARSARPRTGIKRAGMPENSCSLCDPLRHFPFRDRAAMDTTDDKTRRRNIRRRQRTICGKCDELSQLGVQVWTVMRTRGHSLVFTSSPHHPIFRIWDRQMVCDDSLKDTALGKLSRTDTVSRTGPTIESYGKHLAVTCDGHGDSASSTSWN